MRRVSRPADSRHCLPATVLMCLAAFAPANSARADEAQDNEVPQAATKLTMDTGVPVNPLLFGASNTWPVPRMHMEDERLHAAIRLTRVQSLRYPGGSAANFWDLPAGRYLEPKEILSFGVHAVTKRCAKAARAIFHAPDHAFSPKTFSELCTAVGAKPVWIGNLFSIEPSLDARAVSDLKKAGTDIAYYELGNELYELLYRAMLPAVDDYLRRATLVANRLGNEYPDAQAAVCALGSEFFEPIPLSVDVQMGSGRRATWNPGIFASKRKFDAWTVHSDQTGPELLRPFNPDQRPSVLLAQPQALLTNAAETSRTNFGGIPLWLTEYNLRFSALDRRSRKLVGDEAEAYFGQLRDSSLHALHIAGYLLAAVEHHQTFKMAHYSSLMGDAGYGMLRFDRKTGVVEINATGQVFAHISALALAAEQMHPVKLAGGPQLGLAIAGRGDLHALQAVAFSSAKRTALVILNRSSDAQTATLTPKVAWKSARQTTYLAKPDDSDLWAQVDVSTVGEPPWSKPLATEQQELPLSPSEPLQLALPGLSLSVITLE